MITFGLPDDEALQAAIGKTAIRHGQMDYVLRMTIKSLAGLGIREALDATHRNGSAQLRDRIQKLAKQRLGEGKPLLQLEALLTRSRRATDRRNELLHGLWATDLGGQHLLRSDSHTYNPIPSAADVEALADEFYEIASTLNSARLEGFLKEALDARRPAN